MGWVRSDTVVASAIGVSLQHNETFSDWSRRPLLPGVLEYAAIDPPAFTVGDEFQGAFTRVGLAIDAREQCG